jgi:hypothetical protein
LLGSCCCQCLRQLGLIHDIVCHSHAAAAMTVVWPLLRLYHWRSTTITPRDYRDVVMMRRARSSKVSVTNAAAGVTSMLSDLTPLLVRAICLGATDHSFLLIDRDMQMCARSLPWMFLDTAASSPEYSFPPG